MRIYSASNEEALRARDLLEDWAADGYIADGYINDAQYRAMEQETVCDLRRTNMFLRLVLAFFTLIIVIAAAALVVTNLPSVLPASTQALLALTFAVVSYAAAEFSVSRIRFYRHGIEEALLACAVGFFCIGVENAVSAARTNGHAFNGADALVPLAGAVFSFWIWRRFGLAYAFLAAMIFAVFVPDHWTSSLPAKRLIIVGMYAAALILLAAVRRGHRFDYLDDDYALIEAFLWLGIYLTINLQLSSLDLIHRWWGGSGISSEFPRPFYWATWVLTWILPPVVLTRGLRRKDRAVIAVGAIVAILTFITNKPYLGWARHTWDPMLLGLLLTGVAIGLRRWLASGPGGIRHGFTAERLSMKDTHRMGTVSAALGVFAPQAITPAQQSSHPDVQFGGGDSGGGGASSDF